MNACPSDLALEGYLLARSDERVKRHIEGCEACRVRLAKMEEEERNFQVRVYPATLESIVQGRHSRGWAWRPLVLVAAALAVLVVIRRARPPAGYVGTKGSALGFLAFAQGPGGVFVIQDGSSIPAASALRFQIRTNVPCRLWVISVDGSGQVSRLFPSDGDGSAVSGTETLPGGAILDGRAGPERLFAVCSSARLSLEDLTQSVREAIPTGADAVRSSKALSDLPNGTVQATILIEKKP